MMFFLGTHEPSWLYKLDVPLFISARRLRRYRRFKRRATCLWALDSGGFSEISMYGRWETTPVQYAREADGWRRDVGMLAWCAPQDWMCEPHMLRKTGLSIRDHQMRTIFSYEELSSLSPDVPWIPVLQGWEVTDYLRHLDMYFARGHDVTRLDTVGVGSVCRRQGTREASEIITVLHSEGVRIHAFGFKIDGVAAVGRLLRSSDSMAWSAAARHLPPLRGCSHSTCTNCVRWAHVWRLKVLEALPGRVTYRRRRRLRCVIQS